MIKTVYFDLGNVLVFFSFPKMLGQMSRCTGLSLEQIQKLLIHTELREQYEKGLINTKQLYETFLKQAPHPFTLPEFTHAFSDIFTPNTDLWPLIEDLKKNGIRLVLLSNTSQCHFDFAKKHYPILDVFDHKVLSYELGVWKPDIQIFEKALIHSQCQLDECFYTDDIAEFIESARKVGLQGEIFTDVPKLRQDLILRGCTFLK
ncbi:MAG: HAD family phosphatase [Chlamydiae bacterium CG10_big_fil_rev_8_21_14_0_10_42_34]|nr:MAG: HAD family phosphatase [Chlamydiae bacterium CG10_big_fil_rev_8_21_14_0_10_42_34]